MFSFQDLFIAVVFDRFIESGLIALNIKIDVEFGLKIFGNNIGGSLHCVFEEVFDKSECREFVLEDQLFLIERIEL